ncbi:MAG: murein biosynthesis integral membrane protein MurJ [Caldilineaceae bacterium]|nr:murein biosynthesis integral membrane protein MurJ [Caldilineaceae bacterium]
MAATLAASLFGLVREAMVAAHFGTSVATDAYFFSFDLVASLPEFLQSAIGACLIPIYTRSKQEGASALFVNTIINVYLLLLIVIAVWLFAAAPLIAARLASGFDATGRQLVSTMVRLLAPTVVLTGVWSVLKAMLNAEREFFISNFSQALQSLGIIGAVLLLAPQMGIYGLPVGILIASVLQVAWTGHTLNRKGFRYTFDIALRDPRFRQYLLLLGPSLVGSLIGYIEPIIEITLASHLAEGSIAAIRFAGRPMAILTRIAVYSFVTALLPILSWERVTATQTSFKANIVQILNMLLFVLIPLSLLLITLRMPIIQLLFQRGKFDAAATQMTANIFAALVIGLLPMAVGVTLSSVFVALEDTKTPTIWGAGSSFIAKLVFSLILITPLGAVGLALATSLKNVVSATLLLLQLRRLQGLDGFYLATAFGRALIVSLVAVSPVYLITLYLALPPLALILFGSLITAALYAVLSIAVRAPELAIVQERLPRWRRA